MNITDEWLAGFVDGEGSFAATTHPGGGYRISFGLGQTNLEVLEAIRDYLGVGTIYANRSSMTKPMYSLQVGKKADVRAVCVRLLPHLKVKKRQAELAIQLIDTVVDNFYGSDRNEEGFRRQGMRAELFKELKALNRRGAV
jgi:hypothetical protein